MVHYSSASRRLQIFGGYGGVCVCLCELTLYFLPSPNTGKMKDLAFIQDPDGYWIEIFTPHRMVSIMTPLSKDQPGSPLR